VVFFSDLIRIFESYTGLSTRFEETSFFSVFDFTLFFLPASNYSYVSLINEFLSPIIKEQRENKITLT